MSHHPRRQSDLAASAPPATRHLCQADVTAGLEAFAHAELQQRLGTAVQLPAAAPPAAEAGAVRFTFTGDLAALLALQTVVAVSLVRHYPVPRPRALLGDQHLRALLAQIAAARALHPPDAFATLHLGAAGADSSVMTRLKQELARQTGLRIASDDGDLLLRLRRPPAGGDGWEALVRLSPRPLATRPWRVCNMEGALNATVAHAMALLTQPQPADIVLNLACGSGTLLIERLACAPAARLIGCDLRPAALACARANIAASGHTRAIELYDWDARALPLPDASVDALVADLPFGQLVGSHAANARLYPAILAEAARVARAGARCVIITHEVRLMEGLLPRAPHWTVATVLRMSLGGLHLRIYVLERTSQRPPAE